MLPVQCEIEVPLWTEEIEKSYQMLDVEALEIFPAYITVKNSVSWSQS
jgi:hypothetical protein